MINSSEKMSQIIKEWKKSYTTVAINELHPFGEVLEVGFGLGYAAAEIQARKPKSHLIIESDPLIAKEAKAWASKYPNSSVIQDIWPNVLPRLKTFDTIFFNEYPLENELEVIKRLNPEELNLSSGQVKELLGTLEKEFSEIAVHYSDENIDEFYQKIGQFNLKELPQFFLKLKNNGNISAKQYQKALQKYTIQDTNPAADTPARFDPMFLFLDACLKNHMHKGSRFSCFMSSNVSKYEDPQFFEQVITNPDFDYQEKLIPIKVPSASNYEALVMVVEKLT